ncbi:MAG: HYR domain-containing protein [Crocinitomicaceae bacterium]|nr:HYR domain-containing protein [Crocinitomicaceae bacterium]
MRFILFISLIITIAYSGKVNAQTSLNLGEVAFTGVNTDTPDAWTFIFLVDVTTGTTLSVTDEGWFAAGGFRSGPEQTVTWTATEDYSCGTQITIDNTNIASNDGGYATSGTVTGAALSLSIGGEALHMYQGTRPTAGDQSNFITSIQVNGGGWDADATSNTTSAKPSVMTDGLNSMSFTSTEVDNQTLNPALCGSITADITVIYTESNWTRLNTVLVTPACTGILGGACGSVCAAPDVPTITAGATTICPSGSTTLTWTGASLNDATNWHIYTTSCGVGQLGPAQPGTSLAVSPAVTTTYYIRGEDGAGCVDESTGLCGSITITVQDVTPPTITCPSNQIGTVNGACNYSLPDYTGSATAADNCTASPTVTQSPLAGTNVGTGTTVITLTATDGASNTANCNFNVVVSDITPPTITCPANQAGTADGACNFTIPDYTGSATAADNCPGITVTQVPIAGTIVGVGSTTITLTATDGASNSASCNFSVIVTDATNPTITCPANQNVSFDGTCSYTLLDYTGLATAADNCTPAVTVTQSPIAGTVISGTTTITLTADDGVGNTASCTFDVIPADNTNPTIVCPADQNEPVNASCQFSLPDYTGAAVVADNCDPSPAVTQSPVPGTTITGGTVVTLTVTDANSNTSNCNFNAIGIDNTNPTIVCPADQNVSFDATCNYTLLDYTGLATAADNCNPAPAVTQSPVAGTVISATTTITLTVDDGSGNTANCTFDVIPADNTNPTISCPADQNVAVNASCQFILGDYTGMATVADNCDASPVLTQSPLAGTTITGATVVTLTATDAGSNTANCNFNVIGVDAVAPTAVCQNINAYLDGAGNVTIVAGDIDGGSTDNCGSVTLSASQTAFTCANIGANSVTLTVTDVSTNSSNCIAVVTILDTVSPVTSCPGNQTENPDPSCNFTLPDYTSLVSATDNCNASPAVTQSPVAGTVISGTTTITMTSDDGNGNTSSCTFNVILNDATPPTAVCQNINAYLDGAGNVTITAGDLDGGSTDNCSGLTFSASQTAFTCANIGTNNVTLTVTDGNSNSANCIAIVTVIDTISPVVSCPGNQMEVASATCDFVLPDYTGMATGSDNCGTGTVTQSPIAGTTISSNTMITMTADDGNGNTGTCTFDVVLDFSACQGAECSNAIALAPMDPCGDTQTVSGSTVGGTPTTEGTCGTTVGTGGASWYTFTGDGTDWTASTVGGATNYDTKLWIFEGACGSLNCIDGNDDFGSVQSQVSFPTTVGLAYYVIVGGWSSSEGNYDLTLTNVETEAPVADLATLGDINGVCEITVLLEPTATDNCSAVAVTNDATLPITSNTMITWTYTDANGNASNQTQNVVLMDLVAPTASNPDTLYFECIGDAIINETVVDDEADNCTGAITVVHTGDVVTGDGCMDTITRTYNVADGSANNIDVTQIIIIQDVTPPTASNATTLNVQCVTDVPAPATGWVTDEADNCGAPTVTWTSDVSDGLTCPETISRTFTVTDSCGNSINVIQLIVVMDVDAPVADIAALPTITDYCDVTLGTATATDYCSGAITGVSDVTFPINTLGTTTITWTFTDDCGNETTQTQDVVIEAIEVGIWIASDGYTIVATNVNAGVTYQWMNCDGDTLLPGEINSNFTPVYSANFAVIITENGCTDTSACVNINGVGIDEMIGASINFYPNPTTDGSFTIDYDGTLQSVTMIDMLGRAVEVSVDLETGLVDGSALAPGKYMVEVTIENDRTIVQQVMITK